MKYTKEQLLEDALDVAMRSLSTYGEHPIIEQQARKAKAYKDNSQKSSDISVISQAEKRLLLEAFSRQINKKQPNYKVGKICWEDEIRSFMAYNGD